MASILYYYDKTSPYNRHKLGEVQATFNINITLDGTKDSCKVQVHSFERNQLEPYTICYLDTLQSWWIVSNDKTERHANESGFYYVHNLQLVGAIELLNARDLTDCAFYQNRYTIHQFVKRLFRLSNFEINPANIDIQYQGNLNSDEIINYIKTYENYTLLSALKDFFNGYNCDIKMIFNVGTTLTGCTILVNSKTGNISLNVLDIDDFDDIRETRKIDKNSFGTQVISNADNITASKMQVYPCFGGMPLMSDTFNLDFENAYVKLPSKLNDIEWVKMYIKCKVVLRISAGGTTNNLLSFDFFNFDKQYIENILNEIGTYIHSNYYGSLADQNWMANKETIKTQMESVGVSTLRKGVVINANTGAYENPQNILIPNIKSSNLKEVHVFIGEKQTKQAYRYGYEMIGYERGNNKIEITFLEHLGGESTVKTFDNDDESFDCGWSAKTTEIGATTSGALSILIDASMNKTNDYRFAIKYEPMADLKLKVDNDLNGNDIQIYNQNGKLTDGNAFTKLLNSYSKEITTDNITRYMCYYRQFDLPQVGSIVDNNGEKYVINNVSYTFYNNDSLGSGTFPYYVDCEITMSKQIAVKSLMVNPNSNIRDYGIPQQHTVKRKKLYRDYCEFDFNSDTTGNTYYMPIDSALTLNKDGIMYELVKGIIRIDFPNNDKWYYQLDTTRYVFKKLLVTMLDFQDNNVIGNDMQNMFSGFVISKVLTPWSMSNLTNTPIQYTDDSGSLTSIHIIWTTEEQYNEGIDTYINDYDTSKLPYKYNLTSRCFIGEDIYDTFVHGAYEFRTIDTSYNKDPLEIPVFEHTFQIGDTAQVEVGSDIFVIHEELFDYYYYNLFAFEFVDKNKLNEFNALSYSTHNISYSGLGFTFSQNATIQPSGNALYISLYETYNSTQNPQHINKITTIPTDKDLAIYRYEYSYSLNKTIKTLMFIIHLSEDTPISPTNEIILYAHQYKLN